jgi:preprotein translocase subunit YajC
MASYNAFRTNSPCRHRFFEQGINPAKKTIRLYPLILLHWMQITSPAKPCDKLGSPPLVDRGGRVYDGELTIIGMNPNEGDMLLSTAIFSRMCLLAEGAAAGGGAEGGGASPLSGLGPMFLIFILIFMFYLLVLRPQKKDQNKRMEMINAMKKNDRVVTIGGIYGVVMNVKREADEVVLKIDETNDTKIRVTYGAIARVLGDEAAEETKK